MIIVEGPDGAGKTTLVNRLVTELGVEVRPRACTSEDGPVDELLAWIEDDLRNDVHRGIYDRHPFISEPIYGPIIRGEALLGQDEERIVHAMTRFVAMNPLIIFCLPPIEHVRVNVAQSHQVDTPHQQGVLKYTDGLWAAYYYSYLRLMAGGFQVTRWNYAGEHAESRYNYLKGYVEENLAR